MAKSTVTTDAIRQELRRFISPSLDNVSNEQQGGNNLPLDKQTPTVELVVIDCYFPGKMMLRGRLRDSITQGVTTEEVYAHILVPDYHEFVNRSWLPEGTDKIDGKTGWNSRIPNQTPVGVVEAIKGNPLNGHVFLGYVHMTDEGDLEVASEPEHCLTQEEVDNRINTLAPDIADIRINALAPDIADTRINALAPDIADTRAVSKINELVPGMTMDQDEVDGRINLLTPGIADTEIQNDVPGMIETAINNASLALIEMLAPVGTIITSADGTNPGERIPGTTWVPEAEGKFILGAGGGYANGATGGSTTVTLGVNNLPSHKHNVSIVSSGGHTSGTPSTNSTDSSGASTTDSGGNGNTGSGGVHDHKLMVSTTVTYASGSATRLGGTGASPDNGYHIEDSTSHTHSIPSHTHTTPNHSHSLNNHTHAVQNHTHTVSEDNIGSAAPVSIMPPYIARYKWRRTA